ncbi:unnamed protein product [Moneuplotes crassus]|uniref:Inositol polyphosphate-related phosphatase domain-containing protein n=1 Tax=Euplotes crassus TaxID=5936 RepID=A0AAD1UH30_EUPCR|nr:unnamed protein product [Moneuplotes crassus]
MELEETQEETKKIKLEEEYYNIFILTLNCFETKPQGKLDYEELLKSKNPADLQDIVIVGLQEIISAGIMKKVFSSKVDAKDIMAIAIEIQEALKNINSGSEYVLAACESKFTMATLFFCRKEIKDSIENIKTKWEDISKPFISIKGCNLVRFDIKDFGSLIFVNSHFPSGEEESNNKYRTHAFESINKIVMKDTKDKYFYKDHDIQFIFGDLNFRVDIPFDDIIDEINSKDHADQVLIEDMLKKDQLNMFKAQDSEAAELEEMKINFLPTYKINREKGNYELEKCRMPSWCDRILWHQNKETKYKFKVKGNFYESRLAKVKSEDDEQLFNFSDHHPVIAEFKITKEEWEDVKLSEPDIHIVKSEKPIESGRPSAGKKLIRKAKPVEKKGASIEKFEVDEEYKLRDFVDETKDGKQEPPASKAWCCLWR